MMPVIELPESILEIAFCRAKSSRSYSPFTYTFRTKCWIFQAFWLFFGKRKGNGRKKK